jgi:hypothetical protein
MSNNPIRVGATSVMEILIYLSLTILFLSVLIEGISQDSRTVMWWLNLLFIVAIYFTACLYATKDQALTFFVPMIVLVIWLIIAGMFVFFQLPERLCYESRVNQLFFQSHFFYTFIQLLIYLLFIILLIQVFKLGEAGSGETLRQQ